MISTMYLFVPYQIFPFLSYKIINIKYKNKTYNKNSSFNFELNFLIV